MSAAPTAEYDDCLTASWLSARLGIDTARIDRMRRAGELIAVPSPADGSWLYPGWQFAGGAPRPIVGRVLAAARERGLDEQRLYDLLTRRAGLGRRATGEERLADLLVAGEDEPVLAAVRAAS